MFINYSLDLSPNDNEIDNLTLPSTNATYSNDFTPIEFLTLPLQRFARLNILPSHFQDYHYYFASVAFHEPQNFCKTSTHLSWWEVMNKELHALTSTHTWDLVNISSNKSLGGCKWIYKTKNCSSGNIEQYKAHLVTKALHRNMRLNIRRLLLLLLNYL